MNIANQQDQERHVARSTMEYRERRAQEMTKSSTTNPELPKDFALRPLTLDSAVSPLLRKPTAPFDKTERKKAHTSALYYSECFLRGIEPVVADTAAEEAQGKYDKWWVKSTAQSHKHSVSDKHDKHHNPKRRRLEEGEGAQEEGSITSANVVSVLTGYANESVSSSKDSNLNSDEDLPVMIQQISTIAATSRSEIAAVKARVIADLRASGGNVETTEFLRCAEILEAYYRSKSWDGRGSCRLTPFSIEGNWLTLSKPTYNECKGRSEKGEYMYGLGRMSFDMFKPTQLICSIQAAFNNVRTIDPKNPGRPLHVPRKLMKEIRRGGIHLRTYE